MSTAKKIITNTVVQIAGKLITAIIALATVNILSRYFSTSEFGDYGTIYEYLALFGAIADMGIYTLMLREMSKPEVNTAKLYATGSTLRIIITAISMLFAVGIAFFIPAYFYTNIPLGVVIASIGTFFILMSGTVSVVLQYALKMQNYAYALITGKIFTFLGVVAITQYFYPIINGVHTGGNSPFFWILFLGLIGSFIIMGITFYFSQQEIQLNIPNILLEKRKLVELFKQALPFGISMFLTTFYFRMGVLLLGWMLPRSEKINGEEMCTTQFCGDLESAKYLVALRMMEVLLYFPIFFMNSLLPHLTKTLNQKHSEENKQNTLSYSFLFMIIMALPITIGGVLLATPLAGMLASDHLLANEFQEGSDTAFFFLAIALFFAFLNIFSSFVLIALNNQKKVLYSNLIVVTIGLALNFILIPEIGLKGSAISTLVTEIVLSILLVYYLQKIQYFPLKYKYLLKIILAGTIMALFIFFLKDMILFMVGKYLTVLFFMITSAIIFGGILYYTQFFTNEVKEFLKKS
ncbi:TPA: polysaccharide biosynthesis C-terminal domain-containing protein [Candidatus Gracilibacteria bacterium]|nr:polysaccharide biosynthesis C-terminal domain-containing protein [Candidatus Gracilibacteria bacterium]